MKKRRESVDWWRRQVVINFIRLFLLFPLLTRLSNAERMPSLNHKINRKYLLTVIFQNVSHCHFRCMYDHRDWWRDVKILVHNKQ